VATVVVFFLPSFFIDLIVNKLVINIQQYEDQQKILGEHSNYSKTDPEAGFMRMKENHMKNGKYRH
jgi:hypothetical protein